MADEVNFPEIVKVNQVLHGYAEGHRQLYASTQLKPRDIRTMLLLSDISVSGATIGSEGYITGYPLSESSVYALARTWPAPEMHRPGCVWTHTILIDFADLAKFQSVDALLSIFKRPNKDEFGLSYLQSINLRHEKSCLQLSATEEVWTRKIVGALYSYPRKRIVSSSFIDIDSERIVLHLWLQQWPRLRRTLRFCTFTSADRSNDSGPFDLQIMPPLDKKNRIRSQELFDAENFSDHDDVWVDSVIDDLVSPNVSGLRKFIARLGADVAGGRDSFKPLCKLSRFIDHPEYGSDSDGIRNAVYLLENELGKEEARAARSIVAEAILLNGEGNDYQLKEFLFSNLSSIGTNTLLSQADRLGSLFADGDLRRLINIVYSNDDIQKVAQHALNSIPASILVSRISDCEDVLEKLVELRPDILSMSEYWLHSRQFNRNIPYRNMKNGRDILSAMVQAGRTDLAFEVKNILHSRLALETLNSISLSTEVPEFEKWLIALVDNAIFVAEFLGDENMKSLQTLKVLANITKPDFVPNEFGLDPWLSALINCPSFAVRKDTLDLQTFCLLRSFGYVTKCSAELMVIGFEAVHTALASNRLSQNVWGELSLQLPFTSFWFDWDKCQRLRRGVVHKFIDMDTPPDLFLRLTSDKKTFEGLIYELEGAKYGSNYLRKIVACVENSKFEKKEPIASKWIRKMLKNDRY